MPDPADQPSVDDLGAASAAPSPWDALGLPSPSYDDLYPGGLGDFSGLSSDMGHRFGQAVMAVALGQDPDTVHPSVQPFMNTAALMLHPQPPLGPGVFGSLDQLRALQGGQAASDDGQQARTDDPEATNPFAIDRTTSASLPQDLTTVIPKLDFAASDQSVGPQGLQDVDGLPIGGRNVIPRFDGFIADNVSSFFKTLNDNNVPVSLTDGFRSADAQTKYFQQGKGARPGSGLHEAGLAFDVNWKRLTPMQQALAVQTAKSLGFSWGGNFGKVDSVHFYVDPFADLPQRQAYIQQLQQRQPGR